MGRVMSRGGLVGIDMERGDDVDLVHDGNDSARVFAAARAMNSVGIYEFGDGGGQV